MIIVGKGVAGSTLAYLAREQKPNLKIALLHSSRNQPCSLHSTGIVSTFGMEPGSSLRADHICTAVAKAEKFFAKKHPPGVERVPHLYAHSDRENHCYLISPDKYLNWLEEQTHCDFWEEHVEEVEEGRIKTFSGKIFEGKVIVLASGAYIKKENKLFPAHPYVAESSVVKGSYGIFENINWKKTSFVFSCGKANLVYRREDNKVIIGGTTDREEGVKPNVEALEHCYNTLADFFDLPLFNTIEPGVGLRHRGRKRMPYWGGLTKNVYGILGLYKNGWSLAFLAAEELLQELQSLNLTPKEV